MCLIVFAWNTHKDYRLILAANRDELYLRPTEDAQWWPDRPDMLAGRDLEAGGTWLAISKPGRFATVTNYREQSFTKGDHKSRGELVSQFVSGSTDSLHYCRNLDGADYAGFNLLAISDQSMTYVSNRGDTPAELDAGVYGLSNASLDTPWSKITRSKKRLQELIDTDSVNESTLMKILMDRETYSKDAMVDAMAEHLSPEDAIVDAMAGHLSPKDAMVDAMAEHLSPEDAIVDAMAEHLSPELARALTAPFIISEEYGTRSSTILLWHRSGKVEFLEQRFDSSGHDIGRSRFSF